MNKSGVSKRGELVKRNAQILERTFDYLGIHARVVEVDVLKDLAQFNIEIALGTKIDDVLSLKKDIALALAADGEVEIEAPIKGRSLIGIKVPLRTNPNLSPEKFKILRVKEKEVPENGIKIFFRFALRILIIALDWLSNKIRNVESRL